MNIKEFYQKTGADYNEVLRRLVSEELIQKYLKKFPNDPSIECISNSLKTGDYDTAFHAARTLNGLCISLGFNNINDKVTQLYNRLRDGITEHADEYIADIIPGYKQLLIWINELD